MENNEVKITNDFFGEISNDELGVLKKLGLDNVSIGYVYIYDNDGNEY